MQTKLKSKRIQAIIALAIAAVLVLSGAFAWYTFSQNRINTFEMLPTAPNVNLHDDFAGGPEKDVYVENSGDFNVLVRVRLSELVKRGNDLTPENAVDDDDAFGWHIHTPSADGCDICDFEAHNYFDWTMDGQKFYMPAHNSAKGSDSVEPLAIGDKETVIDYAALLKDAFTQLYTGDQAGLDAVLVLMDAYLGGDDTIAEALTAEIASIPDTYTISVKQYASQPESEHLRRLNEVRLTLVPSQIITMQDWINGTTYGTPLFAGDFWVIDADGWCYWANALAPNAATGQLLSAVNYKNNYSNGEFTYKINVHLNATSLDGTSLATFFLVAEQNGGVSDDAMILMFLASGEYIFGEDGEIYHDEGGGFYRKINKNNGRYVNYTLGEKVYVNPGSLPGGDGGGMSVGGQFDIDDEGNITDGGSYQIEDIAIGDNGVPYYDVGGGVYLAPVDESGNPDNSGEKYAIVHTGTDGQTGNDDDIGPVRAEGNFPQWYFVDITDVTDGDVIEAGQKGSLIRANNETEIPVQTFSVQQSVYRVQSITRGENGLLYLKLDEDLYAVALNAYANPVNLTMSEVWGTDAESGEAETVSVPSTYYIIYPAESGKIGTENDTTDITPVISAQPVDISTVYDGVAKTLSVTASGAGTRTYQWYKNGAPIDGATSNTLEVTDVADSGSYDCTVTADVKGHLYASVNTDTVAVAITERPITIAADSKEKMYDGTALTHNSYTITSGSIAIGDSLDVTYTGTRTDYGTADNEIAATTITRAGVDVTANYNVTTVNGTLTVTKRPITITAGSTSKIYDGTPLTYDNYTVTSGSVADGESLSATVSGSITEYGETENVISTTTITRAGVDVTANYEVTTVNGTLTIGLKILSGVTVEVTSNHTYSGVAQTPTYTVKDGGTTLTEGTHFTAAYSNNTNAGTATITLTGTGNYSSQKTQSFTIAKAPLTVTANGRIATYRDAIPTFSVTYNGFVNGEGSGKLSGTLSYDCLYTPTSPVGPYPITPKGLTSDNYAIEFKTGTLTVNAKNLANGMLTVTGGTYIYTGEQIKPTFTAIDGTAINAADYDVSYGANINAGAGSIKITGKGNYSGEATQSFTIAKAMLTVTADNKSIVYRAAAPAYTYIYSGFKGSDTAAAITGTPSLSCAYAVGNGANPYPITVNVSGLSATNYSFTAVNGTLTVNAKALTNAMLTVTNPGTYTYTGTQIQPTFTAIDGSAINASDYTVSYGANVSAGTGSITITGKGNYSSQATQYFTIAKRAITLTAGSASKQYDGTPLTNNSYTLTSGTIADGESISSVTISSTITNAGTIPNVISATTIMRASTDVTANYNVTTVNGTLTITEPYAGGKGTQAEPYLIANKTQLEYMRNMVNSITDYSAGKYFKQNANIDLVNQAWTPIGNSSRPFKGVYNGDGYQISGLNVNSSGYAGLFGYVSGGTIKNLSVKGSVIGTTGSTGGIAGAILDSAIISDCAFSGTVSAASSVGGIVGSAFTSSQIDRCYVTGDSEAASTTAMGYVGGIAGMLQSSSEISSCYSLAKISGSANYKGGVAGSSNTSSKVTNCAFLRTIGYNDTLDAIRIYAASTFTSIGYFSDLNSTLTATNSSGTMPANLAALLGATTGGSGEVWKQDVASGSWPLPAIIRDRSLGDYTPMGDPNYASGNGTAGSPYQIANINQLKYMRDQVNLGTTYENTYFTQTANIELGGENWMPIGKTNATLIFAGNYDGGGHKIGGLYINGTDMAGLFGYIDGGTIKNLFVEGNVANTAGLASGIAVALQNGSISDCVFSGAAKGNTGAAGIVASVYNSQVERCYVTYGSEITATHSSVGFVGGIAAGLTGNVEVRSCYSLAKITGSNANYAGGIIGNNASANSTVSNSAFLRTAALNDDMNAIGANSGTATYVGYFSSVSGTVTGTNGASNVSSLLNLTTYLDSAWIQTKAGVSWPVLANIRREHDGWNGEPTLWFGAGDGSSGNPYQISTPAELYYCATIVSVDNVGYGNKYYKLTADIDLNGIPFNPIGISGKSFAGNFDGNGYTIKGLNVQGGTYIGLFGSVNGGTIRNLSVKGNVSGISTNVGGIVGVASGGTISNCVFSGSVAGTSQVGGIIGCEMTNGTIEYCYVAGGSKVTATTGNYAGGIAGVIPSAATVKSSYALAQVSGTNAGGVVGGASGNISRSAFLKITDKFNATLNAVGAGSGYIINLTGSFADGGTGLAHTNGSTGSMPANLLLLLNGDGLNKYRAATGTENGGYPVLVAIR